MAQFIRQRKPICQNVQEAEHLHEGIKRVNTTSARFIFVLEESKEWGRVGVLICDFQTF